MSLAVLIVTHGGLADELLRAAETVNGRRLDHVVALSLPWTLGADEALTRIRNCVETLRAAGKKVLILSDLFGDTPSNAATACSCPGEVALVTGVNLPMVVRLGSLQDAAMSLDEVARWVEVKGRRAIRRGPCAKRGSPLDGGA